MQSNGKKTTTTTGGAIVLVFSLPYPDMIKNPKKQTNFVIYIRYRKILQKKLKKICRVIFLLYLCTSETKKQHYGTEQQHHQQHQPQPAGPRN